MDKDNLHINILGVVSRKGNDNKLSFEISDPNDEVWFLLIVGEPSPTKYATLPMLHAYRDGICYACHGFREILPSLLQGEIPTRSIVLTDASIDRPNLIVSQYGPEILDKIGAECKKWMEEESGIS